MPSFSKRHRHALNAGSLQVQLDESARGRIRRLIVGHNESYRTTDETGWSYDTDTLEDLATALCDLYGTDDLPGNGKGSDVTVLIDKAPGHCVLDALELFQPPMRERFVADLNQILSEEEAPWRMLDGEMVLLDETFARSELAARADLSIRRAGFSGVSAELRRARNHLADGDGRGAVHRAGSALESVMMALLDVDRAKAAKLMQDLNRNGYFDGLPKELRERFLKQVLGALPWMRNELGGHGQGEMPVEVPLPYAQLATDLAASFCHFLIELKLARDGEPQVEAVEPAPIENNTDAVNFSLAGSADDDIPF